MGRNARRRREQADESATRANACRVGFVDGALVEIVGPRDESYRVEFRDADSGELVHAGHIRTNQWIRTARSFFVRWDVRVWREDDAEPTLTHVLDLRGRRVYVACESRSLGDTLAWMPAIERFRAQHGCELVCSTFLNGMLRAGYPEIEFVEPGTQVDGLYALYRVGWFHRDDGAIDADRNPVSFRERPLAATASDILGLPHEEVRPRLSFDAGTRPIARPYVCIGVHATAQAKYWNAPDGWAELVRFLAGEGFEVVLLSGEGRAHMGNVAPDGVTVLPPGPIDEVVRYLRHAEMFVGVGSGLSWLAWAVGCRTCLISGFSEPYTEMADCIRVAAPPGVCSGCFNRHRLDAGDWSWCPDRSADPARRFECTRSIRGRDVVDAIRPHLGRATAAGATRLA